MLSARGLGLEHVAELLAPALADDAVLDDLRALFRSMAPETLLRASAGLGHLDGRAEVVWPTRDPFFTRRDGRRFAALLGTQELRHLAASSSATPGPRGTWRRRKRSN